MAGPPPPEERRALLDVDDIDDGLLDQVVGGLASAGPVFATGAGGLDDWSKPVAAEAWRAPVAPGPPAAPTVPVPRDLPPAPTSFLVGGGLSLAPAPDGAPPRWSGVGTASPVVSGPGPGPDGIDPNRR